MLLLTINIGSSSAKLSAFSVAADGLRACTAVPEVVDVAEPREQLQAFLARHALAVPDIVAHRVVHGGAHLTSACRIDAAVEAEIERLGALAPLHNPMALTWIRACRAIWGAQVKQVAVFDTAFYAALPDVAATYALPHAVCEKYEIRRYGFHGLAHQAMVRRWQVLHPEQAADARLVSFQLGAGCSVTASQGGRARDTSMGFSPLEGLVMATRSGDLDPGLLTYLQQAAGLSADQAAQMLNHQSGLLGVSGSSGDMRRLLASDEPRARLAVALYCYRARKYLGAYFAVLGGADAILFGGGVGENAPAVRAAILEGFEWAGMHLDATANLAATGREGCISTAASRMQAWVVPVDEAGILAQEALAVMARG